MKPGHSAPFKQSRQGMSQNLLPLPTILLVEPDDQVRPVIRDNLRHWGYTVIVALNVADAIHRTRGGGEPFDLILLNQFEQEIDRLIDMGCYLREQANCSSQTPIVIMAEKYGIELEGRDVQVGESEYVTYLEDGQQLRNLLYKLCSTQKN